MVLFLPKYVKKMRSEKAENGKAEKDSSAREREKEDRQKRDVPNTPGYTIRISNMRHPERKWMLPVSGELLIGRGEHCAIHLEDHSVSKQQCQIETRENGIFIVNLGRVNPTEQNGAVVEGRQALHRGDILTLGRETLRVDEIQSPYGSQQESFSENFSSDFQESAISDSTSASQTDMDQYVSPHATERFW